MSNISCEIRKISSKLAIFFSNLLIFIKLLWGQNKIHAAMLVDFLHENRQRPYWSFPLNNEMQLRKFYTRLNLSLKMPKNTSLVCHMAFLRTAWQILIFWKRNSKILPTHHSQYKALMMWIGSTLKTLSLLHITEGFFSTLSISAVLSIPNITLWT